MAASKGDLTTPQIFWIVVFLLTVIVFIGAAMWLKGYGTDVIRMIPGLATGLLRKGKGGLLCEPKSSSRKSPAAKSPCIKGLSLNMTTLRLIIAVIFILCVLLVLKTLFGSFLGI